MQTAEIKDVVDAITGQGSFDAECAAVEDLRSLVVHMTARSKDFAESLLKQYDDRGSLSDKQMFWVRKLANDAKQVRVNVERPVLKFERIVDMMTRASAFLKRMKIELRTEQDQRVVFKRAGEHSKYNGSVMITDGAPFAEAKLFGIIGLDGVFKPARDCNDDVIELLKKFNENPEEVAQEFGRLMHVCCFCMRGLRDKRSTDAGYGPVCADRFGLAWG